MQNENELTEFCLGLYSGRAYKVLRTMFLFENATDFVDRWHEDSSFYYEDDKTRPIVKLEPEGFHFSHRGSTGSMGKTALGLVLHYAGELARTNGGNLCLQINKKSLYYDKNAFVVGKFSRTLRTQYKKHLAEAVRRFRDILLQINEARNMTNSPIFNLRVPVKNAFYVDQHRFFNDFRYNSDHCFTRYDDDMVHHKEQDGFFNLNVSMTLNELNFLIDYFKGKPREKLVKLYGEAFTDEMIGVPHDAFYDIVFKQKIKRNYEKMTKVFIRLFPKDKWPGERDIEETNRVFSDAVKTYEEGLFKLNA